VKTFSPRRTQRTLRGTTAELQAVHHPSNAILQVKDVKIDSESELQATQLEMAEKLSVVDIRHTCHGFELDNDALVDDQIDPLPGADFHRGR